MSKLVSHTTGQTYAVCVHDVSGTLLFAGWTKDKCYKCDAVVLVDPNDLADPDTLYAKRICTKCALVIAQKLKGGETVENF